MMSAAVERFESLKRKFRSEIRSRKLSATQRHHISAAASRQQVIEVAIAAMILGAPHDRAIIEQLQSEIRLHLKLAGAPKSKD